MGKTSLNASIAANQVTLKEIAGHFEGEGDGGKAVNEVEGVDGFLEISVVNWDSVQNRHNALDSDTESESEEEFESMSINSESNNAKLLGRMTILFNLCPDVSDRLKHERTFAATHPKCVKSKTG